MENINIIPRKNTPSKIGETPKPNRNFNGGGYPSSSAQGYIRMQRGKYGGENGKNSRKPSQSKCIGSSNLAIPASSNVATLLPESLASNYHPNMNALNIMKFINPYFYISSVARFDRIKSLD